MTNTCSCVGVSSQLPTSGNDCNANNMIAGHGFYGPRLCVGGPRNDLDASPATLRHAARVIAADGRRALVDHPREQFQ